MADELHGHWIKQVLELSSQGKTYKEVAQVVGVTESYIKSIVHRFLRDQGYSNMPQAVAEAVRKGWIK